MGLGLAQRPALFLKGLMSEGAGFAMDVHNDILVMLQV